MAGSDAGAVFGRGRPSSLRLQHVALNWGNSRPASASPQAQPLVPQSPDHIGFALEDESAVDAWDDYLSVRGVAIVAPPRTHRDGTRSLYCKDPHGNTVQLLREPRAAGSRERARSGSRAREGISN